MPASTRRSSAEPRSPRSRESGRLSRASLCPFRRLTSRRLNRRLASAMSATVVTASAAAAGPCEIVAPSRRSSGVRRPYGRYAAASPMNMPTIFSTTKVPTMTRTAADWLRKITPQQTPIRLNATTANRTAADDLGCHGHAAVLGREHRQARRPDRCPASPPRRSGRAARARQRGRQEPRPPRCGEQALGHGAVAVLAADAHRGKQRQCDGNKDPRAGRERLAELGGGASCPRRPPRSATRP